MPATSYKQYFNIDEKYYAVVTKELIDQGRVRWDAFYPHETFIQLLRQVVDMLSGKESRGIWFEGIFGTGKSHAALTVKSLLEALETEVRRYFDDFKLSEDLCNHFLAARSEEMNGPLIVIHRIGSSNIKNDDDLVWAVQSSISRALAERGIENHAEGTLKDALIKWLKEKAANKQYLNALLSDDAFEFNGMNADQLIDALNSGNADSIQYLMTKLIRLGRDNNMSFLKMDAPMLADWIRKVIAENHLGSIVFIWDEFSEFFRNCQNSLTGFQTLAQISEDSPFYFVLVTHESEALISNTADRIKIKNRFIEPSIRIELPDNMAFRLMAQAMKETDDPVMRDEWHKAKQAMRSGTENVAGIVGMASALKEHIGKLDAEARYLNLLQQKFINGLRAKGLVFIENGSTNCVPGNVSLSFANASGEMLLHRLDLMGISIATGSACNSKETTVSHVIQAIGVPEKYANGTIRISFGPENTEEEVLTIIDGIFKILNP